MIYVIKHTPFSAPSDAFSFLHAEMFYGKGYMKFIGKYYHIYSFLVLWMCSLYHVFTPSLIYQ